MRGGLIFAAVTSLFLLTSILNGRSEEARPGMLDESFYVGTLRSEIDYLTPGWGKVIGLALGANDEVYIGGHFTSISRDGTRKRWNGLARLHDDGRLDESFAIPIFNWTTNDQNHIDAHEIIVTNDGVFAGFSVLSGFRFDGSPLSGWMEVPPISRLDLRDGKRLYFSSSRPQEANVKRWNQDRSEDATFTEARFGVGSWLSAPMLERANGQVYVAGNFSNVNDKPFPRLVRLNQNGTIDESFRPDARLVTGGTNTPNILVMALQANGKLLVAGSFSMGDAAVRGNIVRLNVDGTIDTSFDVGSGATKDIVQMYEPTKINRVVLERDGDILVAGDFQRFAGVLRDGVARLHGDPVVPLEIRNFRTLSGTRGLLELAGTADVVDVEATSDFEAGWQFVDAVTVTNEVSTSFEVPVKTDQAQFFRVKKRQ